MNGRQKPRVAIALNMLSPYWHDVFERLSDCWKVKIFVATLNEPNRQYGVPDFSNFRFEVVKSRNMMLNLSRFGWKTKYLHLQWGLWRDLRSFRPDIILSNELGPRTLLAMAYGRVHSVPVIPWICASKHTERNNSRLREVMRRFFVRTAPVVCTNLTEAREYLRDVLGVAEEDIYATPYVVDVRKFATRVAAAKTDAERLKAELSLDGRVLLYVGQMIERKGLRQFFQAVCAFSMYLERLTFLLVGGHVDKELSSLLDQRHVQWRSVPFVQPDSLYKYYACADVFFYPSLEDEWGIVLSEAAAAGLPILASKYAAASRDLVCDEKNGKIFDPLDPRSVQQSLQRILALSDSHLQEWGHASREIVEGVDIDFTVSNMNAALRKVLKQHGTRK